MRDANHPVLGVEHDDAEMLDRQCTVLRQQMAREIAWRTEPRPLGAAARRQRPSAQLDGGDDLRGA